MSSRPHTPEFNLYAVRFFVTLRESSHHRTSHSVLPPIGMVQICDHLDLFCAIGGLSNWGLVQMGVVQMGVVQLGVVQLGVVQMGVDRSDASQNDHNSKGYLPVKNRIKTT